MKSALIAMSGGVDSSVAAYLMKQEGYNCIGCTMKLYDSELIYGDDASSMCSIKANGKTCCSLDDVEDARAVASRLGMDYYVLNFTEDFKERIIDHFVESYLNAKTPNPCIDCNKYMKFDKLRKRAEVMGCDYIVTGHYARIEERDGKFYLLKGVDDSKDQSYVLYNMTQDELKHTKFPLGGMRKTEIREIADSQGFVNASKPDSQDICFVPDGDYAKVINKLTYKEIVKGNFVDLSGKIYGPNKGIINYTIGQRKGLGIAAEKPLYVISIDAISGDVILGDNEDLFKKEMKVKDMNWISGEVPSEDVRCQIKIRYKAKPQWATVHVTPDSEIEVLFDEPQRAITPGQSAVLYDGDIVLGGGIIM